MPSYIAAFALQQLKDMEQLQRDFGRRRIRRRRGTASVEPAPSSRRQVVRRRWYVVPVRAPAQLARTDPNAS